MEINESIEKSICRKFLAEHWKEKIEKLKPKSAEAKRKAKSEEHYESKWEDFKKFKKCGDLIGTNRCREMKMDMRVHYAPEFTD